MPGMEKSTTHTRVSAPLELAPGEHVLAARFDRDGRAGTLTIAADGVDLASVAIPRVVRILGSTGLDIGRDALSPVVDDYVAPFPFTGAIDRVVFEIRSRRDAAWTSSWHRTSGGAIRTWPITGQTWSTTSAG